jgi:adenosine deaminase
MSDTAADLDAFIRGIPKAELHMHLEGSIEAEMLFAIAQRNNVPLRWPSEEALRGAYEFDDLQSFLNLYYEGCRVLATERDFYDITLAYLRRAHQDRVLHAELFVGPQSFTDRGIDIAVIMNGVLGAMQDARRDMGISAGLLVSAQRHRTEAAALELLDSVMPWADRITGFGLGGAERGNPPARFIGYFRTCRERGFRVTAHAGEEGPADYVRQAVELLHVDRIDHGNACLDYSELVQALAARRIPLTVCPLSNVKLQVVPSLAAHPLLAMLRAGLNVTVNSDDPSYFGGYVGDNLVQCQRVLGLSVVDIVALARNSFAAAFMPPADIAAGLAQVDAWCAQFPQFFPA